MSYVADICCPEIYFPSNSVTKSCQHQQQDPQRLAGAPWTWDSSHLSRQLTCFFFNFLEPVPGFLSCTGLKLTGNRVFPLWRHINPITHHLGDSLLFSQPFYTIPFLQLTSIISMVHAPQCFLWSSGVTSLFTRRVHCDNWTGQRFTL